MDERHEHHVEFLEAGEDSSEPFESTKQSLYFITPLVHFLIVLPRFKPVGFGWHNGSEAKIKYQLSGFVSLVGLVHKHVMDMSGAIFAPAGEKFPTLWAITGLTGRK